jgi:LmbE family N-acetylglucosaminyl deacetylase
MVKQTIIILFGVVICGCKNTQLNYSHVAQMQDASVILWEIQGANPQKAMFIFPHPDDEITCAGTIAKMKANNWEVYLLTLTKGSDDQDKMVRTNEWNAAAKNLGYDKTLLYDFYNNNWEDIMQQNVQFWPENLDSISSLIYNTVLDWQPDMLITYDDAIGGYGHPEHLLSAKIVRDLFTTHAGTADFSPKYLYQMTLPQALEDFIVADLPSYKLAIELYGVNGLPEPDLAVEITNFWPAKRNAAACYQSQAEILNKFYLLPSNADTAAHYATFNKEYYREIKR